MLKNLQADGGRNGGNGHGISDSMGLGSGVDVSSFGLHLWTLSPGEGGRGYKCPSPPSNDDYCGGGGGGVLINGIGPPRKSNSQGEGYGGGGAGNLTGLPGIVLINVRVHCLTDPYC